MKFKFPLLLCLGLFFLSCEKEEPIDQPSQFGVPQRTYGPCYYITGTVADTTTGASVKGAVLASRGCGVTGRDRALGKKGRYIAMWRNWREKGWTCEPSAGYDLIVYRGDSVCKQITVDPDTLIPNDTVVIDLFF